MTEQELKLRRKVTDLANSYVGKAWEWNDVLEGLIKTYNNYPNIGRGIKYTPSLGGWCALFVSDMFILNDIAKLIPCEIGAYEIMKDAQKLGIWKDRKSGYIPKPGDAFVLSYPRTKADGTVFTQYHTGIVTNADATIIYTTEGNVQDQVWMSWYYPDDSRILGYITPDFAKAAEEFVDYKLGKTTTEVYLKQGPGLLYPRCSIQMTDDMKIRNWLYKNEVVKIVEEKNGYYRLRIEGVYTWYPWVNAKYVKII